MNLTGIKEVWKDPKRRKPYLTALLLVLLYIADIFFISGFFGAWFGVAGTVIHELLLAAMGVGVFLILHGKMKVIFPFKRPEWAKIVGTILLWRGAYLFVNLLTGIMLFFFPQQVTEASEGVSYLITEMPVLLGLLVVAVTPAVCEEIAFRGALLGCFRGGKNKWFGIILVSLFFGACHGSLWRMIPTAILGVAMGYIFLETENMLYNMLFHFVNNAVPVLLLGLVSRLAEFVGASEVWEAASAMEAVEMPLMTVGVYVMEAGGVPLLIYIGNYFLHRGQRGYERGLFPPEKKKLMTWLVGAGLGVMVLGVFLITVSVSLELFGTMHSMMRSLY